MVTSLPLPAMVGTGISLLGHRLRMTCTFLKTMPSFVADVAWPNGPLTGESAVSLKTMFSNVMWLYPLAGKRIAAGNTLLRNVESNVAVTLLTVRPSDGNTSMKPSGRFVE